MARLSERLTVPAIDIAPAVETVLRANGVPPDAEVSSRVAELVGAAVARIRDLDGAVAIVAELSAAQFHAVFTGAGTQGEPSPLAGIYPRASRLALFAVTLGERISEEINGDFATGDFALGAMLDTAASLAMDEAVCVLERRFEATAESGARVLSYSPGYCGWPLSGQGALFAYLRPAQIGIGLEPSFLMRPLKSVSGVLVAATPARHAFANDFEFCKLCHTKTCRERLGRILPPAAGE